MRSSRHSSSSRNAFSASFLKRLGERDEPLVAGEADVAGPWHVEEVPTGFGLFRQGESLSRESQPSAVFTERWLALLAAAVLPGTGRDALYRLAKEAGPEGFAVAQPGSGEAVGYLALFDETLLEALNAVTLLVSQPASLAFLLEAAGQVALERAGAILDESVE
ncbi:MAG TPA: hypothetical protein VF173_37710 [Thermoanaerobaculia bacterium]|nr:hypothetical protein [Thermoanaerobaculia bacterium]